MAVAPDLPDQQVRVAGFYTQAYNEIVRPNQVWVVPKYLLRRWGPYLSPTRFWIIVAARQLAYWNDDTSSFEAYDARIAQEAHVSRIHYRQSIKAEMGEAQKPLSLFLTKRETEYHVVDGVTRPKPTTYYVRLDTPLTPADAHHLTGWLQSHQIPRRADDVAAVLQNALLLPRKDLLAPFLAPFLQNPPAKFQAATVLDVVQTVFGSHIAKNGQVLEAAEALHARLTDDDYVSKQYFRSRWLDILKPGPAYMVAYLRSLCFFNEETGELRNVVTFNLPHLADSVGIDVRTLSRWINSITAAVPDQAIPPFMRLVEKKRASGNEVEFTYEIGMIEPLTEEDLTAYRVQLSEPDGQKHTHNLTQNEASDGQKHTHELTQGGFPNGQKHTHDSAQDQGLDGQNHIHDPNRTDKNIAGDGQKHSGSQTKIFPYKYYKVLLQALDCEDINTFLALTDSEPAWKIGDGRASQSFAAAAASDLDALFELLNIDETGPSRPRIKQAGLTLEEVVAWHLYALEQRGLESALSYTISRAGDGRRPPEPYNRLAALSWELWRCYASLLVLPPTCRPSFQNSPSYADWMKIYGRRRPADLPFGVGEGVESVAALVQMQRPAATETKETDDLQSAWEPILQELKLRLGKTVFAQWLAGSWLQQVEETEEGQHWIVVVRNPLGVEWLTHRLNRPVIEPLAQAIHNQAITISYIHE